MTLSRTRMHSVGLALAALALGCGPAVRESASELSAQAMDRLARAPLVYAPATVVGATSGNETEALRRELDGALEPQARVRIRPDVALDLAASALAEDTGEETKIVYAPLAQWLLWRSGSIALYRNHYGGWVTYTRRYSAGAAMLREHPAAAARDINVTSDATLSFGLSRFTSGRLTAEMIVLGRSAFDAASFLKSYAPGAPLTLKLTPRRPIREIRFLVDRGTAIDDDLVAPQPDGSFFISRSVPTTPGRYFIEVLGPGPERATLMFVPIYVGIQPPSSPDDFIRHPTPLPADLPAWGTWLAALIDPERAKLGKSPVKVDARLTALALERSLPFADGRRPVLADSEPFAARLRREGIAAASFQERVVTAFGSDAVMLELLKPSVRQRLVFGDRVAIGAGASPRPRKETEAQSFSVAVESVVQP